MTLTMKLTPDWIVGFVDGDGHFGFQKSTLHTNRFYFVVSQNQSSVSVLYQLKRFFKCGVVTKSGQNMKEYKVNCKEHLIHVIVPFFLANPLKTVKRQQFEVFLQKLIPESSLTNMQTTNAQPLNDQYLDLTDDWLLGFIDAKGSFVCTISNHIIRPQLIIALHSRDKLILDSVQKHLNRGVRSTRKSGVEVFQLSSNKDMCFLVKRYLLTSGFKDRLCTEKRIRARKWSKIILLMAENKHKTSGGFEKIKKLYQSF